MRLLAAYDIADDQRRADVALVLSAHGPRVQLSVFEVELPSESDLIALRAALRGIIDGEEDQVRLYRVADEWGACDVLGAREVEMRRDFWIV